MFPLASLEVEKQGANPEPIDQVQTLQISKEKIVRVGLELEPDIKEDISKVLSQYSDSFTSKATEIIGVDPQIASYSLNINPRMKLVIYKKRKFVYERQKLIAEKIKKLLDAEFIREVTHPEWVANVVLVKKVYGKYLMCVDYTDLNKACPKDSYPLSIIDQLVDSTTCH